MTKSKRSSKEKACMQCKSKCMKIHGNVNGTDSSSPGQPSPPNESTTMPMSFFKIMLDDFDKILYLPPKCSSALRCMTNKHVLVQDSYGLSWRVLVTSVNGTLAFAEGWRNFVLDHAIKFGELVVFKLISKVTISAHVFATSACERHHYCKKSRRQNQQNKYRKRKLSQLCSLAENDPSVTRDSEEAQSIGTEKSSPKEKATAQGNDTDGCSGSRLDVIDCKPVNMLPELDTSCPQLRLLSSADCEMNEVGKDLAIVSFSEPVRSDGCDDEPMLSDQPSELEIVDNKGLKLEIVLSSSPGIRHSSEFEDRPCSSHDAEKSVEYSRADSSEHGKIAGKGERAPQLDCNEATTNGRNEGQKDSSKLGQDKQAHNLAAALINGPIRRRTRSRVNQHLIAANGNTSKRKSERKSFQDKEDVIRADEDMSIIPVPTKDAEVVATHSVEKSRRAKSRKTAFSEENLSKVKTETAKPAENLLKGCDFSISTSVEYHSWHVLPVRLPVKFRKLHGGRKVVVIQDSSMRSWPVLYHDSDTFVGFTSGWKEFTKANHVKQGDKCEVQLLNAAEAVLRVTFSKS